MEKSWLWHVRFGHLGSAVLGQLGKMVRGLPRIDHIGELCDSCLAGKHMWLTFPKATRYRAADALELFHGNLCCPITSVMHGERRYILLVDDSSRHMWLRLMPPRTRQRRR